jgi:glucokinase
MTSASSSPADRLEPGAGPKFWDEDPGAEEADAADGGDDPVLLAIDLGATKTAVAVTDLRGRPLARSEMPTGSEAGAPSVMRRVADAGRALLDQVRDPAPAVAAVAAVTPGIVLEDRVLLAPNNRGWESLGLARELRAAFGVEVAVVDNDVKAAARAEARWGRLTGSSTGLLVNLGTGLAFAAVVNGEVLLGAHGAAGEFGYQLTGDAGDRPFAEGGAPLEEIAGGRGIAERVSACLGRRVTTAEAFALARSEPQVRELLAGALAVLGRHVANLALAFDPEVIAIGGGMMGSAPAILPVLREQLDRAVPYPPRLEAAHFARDGSLAGAILLASEAVNAVRPA